MPAVESSQPTPREVALSILWYTTCSSLALISNKVVLYHLPVPGLIFCLQIAATVGFIQIGKAAELFSADALTLPNIKVFIPYICSFVISLYSNGRALNASNVETVIVFRACSPLCVCILDWLFLGRELPSMRSLMALVGVVFGAFGYVMSDSEFAVKGISAYFWVMMNLAGIVFEMTYGKGLISSIKFANPIWGSTLYTNSLAFLPMLLVALSTSESSKLASVEVTARGICWLLISCVIGIGISWSGWNCRAKVSATRYTLLGVVCKFISVFINVLLWDKHATPQGLFMLFICLVSSAAYKQAPMREKGYETVPTKSEDLNRIEETELGKGVTIGVGSRSPVASTGGTPHSDGD